MCTRHLAVLGLALAVAGFAGTVSISNAANVGGGTATTKPERHPAIHQALRDLREAKAALEHADHDFQGHRVAALKATDEAISECEQALKADPN